MNHSVRIFILLASLAVSAQNTSARIARADALPSWDRVIHGADHRVEAYEYPDPEIRQQAQAVAGMVWRNQLKPDPVNPDQLIFERVTASEAVNLCPEERFAKQPSLTECSGFLVAPDLLLTAGHCVARKEKDCEKTEWIFDYIAGVDAIPVENVYKCKKILGHKLQNRFFSVRDYAIIQLDRPVRNRRPLPVRTSKRVKKGEPLYVIGHPLGLPLKIADGAKVKGYNWKELLLLVRSLFRRTSYFTANLDTFGGNSGSPILNGRTNEVEGILIQGDEDFVLDEDRFCQISKKKTNSRWSAEEMVLRIRKVPHLQELIHASYERF